MRQNMRLRVLLWPVPLLQAEASSKNQREPNCL